jgi:hypothetical protein
VKLNTKNLEEHISLMQDTINEINSLPKLEKIPENIDEIYSLAHMAKFGEDLRDFNNLNKGIYTIGTYENKLFYIKLRTNPPEIVQEDIENIQYLVNKDFYDK